MMRIEVPFYKQTTVLNCGPMALRMVLDYFGEDLSIEELEKITEIKNGKGLWSIQLAIASSELGYKAEFYSKNLSSDQENLEMDFYKKYAEGALSFLQAAHKKALEVGANVSETRVSLKELLGKLSADKLIIVLLDWNVVRGEKEKGYQGHFVPVVGYDEENVYVHNQGSKDPRPFYEIPLKVFDEARKAQGTDEDFLVVYRKT